MDYAEARGVVGSILSKQYRGFEKLAEVLETADRAEGDVAAAQQKIAAATEELRRIFDERNAILAGMAEERAQHQESLEQTRATLGAEVDQLRATAQDLTAAVEGERGALRDTKRDHEARLAEMEKELWSKKAEISDEVNALAEERDKIKGELAALRAKFGG